MSESSENDTKMNQTNPNDNSQKKSPKLVDMLLSTGEEGTVDVDTMIKETQKRVWRALKTGYEYSRLADKSDQFMRENVFSRISMVVLYVDLVGSTKMSLELPEEKLATIISSFAQEMAYTINHHNGYVLKFVGDAVIGYFVASENSLKAVDDSISCAKSMIKVISEGINPILNQYDYPDLKVKIGLDYGENIIVRYGSNIQESYVDILGPSMSIASKIQNMADPSHILVGDDVFTRVHPSIQKSFKPINLESHDWKYRSRVTDKIYQVYEYQI
jgi:class 3 adenylate cyclase